MLRLNHQGPSWGTEFHHKSLIAAAIARKQRTHRTIGPEAPLNLNPKPSNSMGPEELSRNTTMHKAERAALGSPTVAAKCAKATSKTAGFMSMLTAPPRINAPPKIMPPTRTSQCDTRLTRGVFATGAELFCGSVILLPPMAKAYRQAPLRCARCASHSLCGAMPLRVRIER